MDVGPEAPADVDAAVARALAAVGLLEGVHRVGLALVEGAGRRLQFTSSDRSGDTVEWCHIDAYDDVPLTAVVRTGETVVGTLEELEARFPSFATSRAATPTVGVVAVPLLASGGTVGGLVAFLDAVQSVRRDLAEVVASIAAATVAQLERAEVERARAERGATTDADELPETSIAASSAGRSASFTVATASDVSTARRRVRALLRGQGVDDGRLDDTVVCLSEVLTNVVMHVSAPAQVRVDRHEDVLRVVVRDRGSGRGRVPAVVDLDDPLRVHGRGLQILDALSSRWSAEPAPDGSTVWFELDL